MMHGYRKAWRLPRSPLTPMGTAVVSVIIGLGLFVLLTIAR